PPKALLGSLEARVALSAAIIFCKGSTYKCFTVAQMAGIVALEGSDNRLCKRREQDGTDNTAKDSHGAPRRRKLRTGKRGGDPGRPDAHPGFARRDGLPAV